MSTVSLQEAARALVEKLDEAMPFIDRMCAMQQNRGQPYSGPQLGDELEALRAVLVDPVSGGSCDTALETSGDVEALHTPGPWWNRYDEDGIEAHHWVLEGGHGAGVSGVHIAYYPKLVEEARKTQKANARLIAAAPHLLEALQEILALDDGDSPDLWHFEAEFANARSAIAKALGRST